MKVPVLVPGDQHFAACLRRCTFARLTEVREKVKLKLVYLRNWPSDFNNSFRFGICLCQLIYSASLYRNHFLKKNRFYFESGKIFWGREKLFFCLFNCLQTFHDCYVSSCTWDVNVHYIFIPLPSCYICFNSWSSFCQRPLASTYSILSGCITIFQLQGDLAVGSKVMTDLNV